MSLLDNLSPRQNPSNNFLEKNQEQITQQNQTANKINTAAPRSPIPLKAVKSKLIAFRTTKEIHSQLELLAKQNKTSLNNAVEHCINQYFLNK